MSTHIASRLHPDEYISLYKMQNPYFENRAVVNLYIDSLSPARKNKLRVIMGHGAYWGIHKRLPRTCRYVVFLREPLARALSNYAYFLRDTKAGFRKNTNTKILDKFGRPYSFEKWFIQNTVMHDYMTRYLYYVLFYKRVYDEMTDDHQQKIIDILRSFYLVGLVERPMDYWYLYDSLGISLHASVQHVTDRQFYPQSIVPGSVMRYLGQDVALYRQHIRPQYSMTGLTRVQLYARAMKDRIISSL